MKTLSRVTKSIRPQDVEKSWILIDAEGLVVGRVASIIANILNLFLSAILMFGDGPVPADLGWFGRVCGDIGTFFMIA